jgi:hypothetical protein
MKAILVENVIILDKQPNQQINPTASYDAAELICCKVGKFL